ncbi:hypothetical protein CFR78_10255 [Komagataeibacter rhaeticus]|nr:hypothetical protein GLUCORHAEAF1_15020 [Komagataeibacter rhaeticus AF1]PYD53315.1 hypothetical protein CFR78_10255 [Komagataeibacter rhaeticus]GBQ12187.1 hypothetical protein AA16663_1096 [Komagataeibacter rhaeticus DSM 16663]
MRAQSADKDRIRISGRRPFRKKAAFPYIFPERAAIRGQGRPETPLPPGRIMYAACRAPEGCLDGEEYGGGGLSS